MIAKYLQQGSTLFKNLKQVNMHGKKSEKMFPWWGNPWNNFASCQQCIEHCVSLHDHDYILLYLSSSGNSWSISAPCRDHDALLRV
jgi:hypothetical protein